MTHEFAFEAHPTPEQIQYLEDRLYEFLLTTFTFQAPVFYAKRGFETLCAVDDFPRGHQSLMLRKRLSA